MSKETCDRLKASLYALTSTQLPGRASARTAALITSIRRPKSVVRAEEAATRDPSATSPPSPPSIFSIYQESTKNYAGMCVLTASRHPTGWSVPILICVETVFLLSCADRGSLLKHMVLSRHVDASVITAAPIIHSSLNSLLSKTPNLKCHSPFCSKHSRPAMQWNLWGELIHA